MSTNKQHTLSLKEPLDAAPAQASTHAGGPDQRTTPTRCARHRLPAPMSLPRLQPCNHAALAHSACRNGLSTHVKSHRGEPINERADTLAEEGRTISDDDKRWDDRTDLMTFEVQKGDTTVQSVWTNSVRNAFQKQAGWAKLQKVRAMTATHWTARMWYRHNQR